MNKQFNQLTNTMCGIRRQIHSVIAGDTQFNKDLFNNINNHLDELINLEEVGGSYEYIIEDLKVLKQELGVLNKYNAINNKILLKVVSQIEDAIDYSEDYFEN